MFAEDGHVGDKLRSAQVGMNKSTMDIIKRSDIASAPV